VIPKCVGRRRDAASRMPTYRTAGSIPTQSVPTLRRWRSALPLRSAVPRLEHAEGQERASLVYALAAADSASLAGRAGVLWRDPRLRPTERLFPALLDSDRGIMLRTYRQMRTDFDGMAAAVPTSLVDILPLAARELCDVREVTGARELLGRAVAQYPSMQPTAARALEQIEVCAAERDAESAAAKSWFERVSRARGD